VARHNLDSTFERRRIYVNDFVLPSHPYIDGKTFIDCDIIGPANIYFQNNNQANPVRPPTIDAICLHPDAKFNSGFIFSNRIFKNCSFQRITAFVSAETYELWKNSTSVNWIGVAPSEEQIATRKKALDEGQRKLLEQAIKLASSASPTSLAPSAPPTPPEQAKEAAVG
jgi:hypothetical protein